MTKGINSIGHELGIYESVFYINQELKYTRLFDQIEDDKVRNWSSFLIISLILQQVRINYLEITIIFKVSEMLRTFDVLHIRFFLVCQAMVFGLQDPINPHIK